MSIAAAASRFISIKAEDSMNIVQFPQEKDKCQNENKAWIECSINGKSKCDIFEKDYISCITGEYNISKKMHQPVFVSNK